MTSVALGGRAIFFAGDATAVVVDGARYATDDGTLSSRCSLERVGCCAARALFKSGAPLALEVNVTYLLRGGREAFFRKTVEVTTTTGSKPFTVEGVAPLALRLAESFSSFEARDAYVPSRTNAACARLGDGLGLCAAYFTRRRPKQRERESLSRLDSDDPTANSAPVRACRCCVRLQVRDALRLVLDRGRDARCVDR